MEMIIVNSTSTEYSYNKYNELTGLMDIKYKKYYYSDSETREKQQAKMIKQGWYEEGKV